MDLYTPEQFEQLLQNGQDSQQANAKGMMFDPEPVVKWFAPFGAATWLITEIHPDDPTIAFGLADLGMGLPEIGNISVSEIQSIVGPAGLKIERDLFFKADRPLSLYAEEARLFGHIAA